jgi:carboxyl-terminal processing protease
MLLLFLSGRLILPVLANPTDAPVREKPGGERSAEKTLSLPEIHPGKYDGNIAWFTASMLEQVHYSKQPLDRAMSAKFLDRYLEGLDPQHAYFLQSDVDDFDHYHAELGDLTINPKRVSDLTPAIEIFSRFLERLQQRVAYVDEVLKSEKFNFDADERITISRKEMPYPKDLSEAKKLWRDRLRAEFLEEKLRKIEAKPRLAKLSQATTNAVNSKSQGLKPDKNAKPKSDAEDIAETLGRSYHRLLRNYISWNNEDVLQAYLATLTRLYDPHSDYMGPEHLEQFAIQMNLRLSGIGAQLTSKDGYCTIDNLLDGYPAAKSKKIKKKDRIVAVAQGDKPPVDVVEMNLNKVVHLIRGPKGTEVRLTIVPDGAPLSDTIVVGLTREDIKLEDQAAKAKIIEFPRADGRNLRMGVIDLRSFYAPFDFKGPKAPELAKADDSIGGKSTSEDVARLLKKLKAENVEGIILDLRLNGGGSLEEAVKLTGLFIKEGPIVQVRDFRSAIEVETDKDPSIAYDGPLVVLTSRFSASASEIVAGALQDYGRALVVGDASTHGKGTVQSVNYLSQLMQLDPTNDLGALKVTIKKFYRASGVSTQLKGVTPDIVLPSVLNDSKEIGEASLDNPLPCDTIDPADYKPVNMVTNLLPELRRLSDYRVKESKDFGYIREDIDLYKKQQADKTISLNEKQRLKEREEATARQKARDQERRSRSEPKEKVYEITLKLAGQPGLPPPVQKTNVTVTATTSLQGTGAVQVSKSSATITATSTTQASPLEEDADEEKSPLMDPGLTEAEQILVDYFSLLKKQTVAATAIH